MDRRYEETFLQRRHTNGQQTHEKVLNITHHPGDANQNHNEISPYTCENGKNQNTRNKCWQECRRKVTSCSAGGNAKWYSYCGRQYGDFSKKSNNKLPCVSVNPQLDIYLKNMKTQIQKGICTPMFIVVLFAIAKF